MFKGTGSYSEFKTVLTSRTDLADYLKSIWAYLSLILSFAIRDIRVKYAQTYLGILWSILQSVIGVGIVTFFFGFIIKINTGDIPYFLYVFPGMASWYFFSFLVGYVGSSMQQSQHLIQKVYFPRLIVPLSQSVVGLIDFCIWIAVCLIFMLIFRNPFSINLIFLPVFIVLNLATGLSVAVWLSALTARYRDLQIIIPFIIGFGIFVTPVFFPEVMIPAKYSFLLFLNPMAGVISGLRWCILGTEIPSLNYLFGFIPVIFLFVTGMIYFIRVEYKLVDRM
ncbi:MAG TPA: ABC transporter permease [Prolixibacteraceae bacterium]|nr:ABC transporter permease [Prolixibacteraceae bacterium]HQJ86888.1 ABC transporter permease [Prolixibacteraceae bacterium]